jgi:TRAP-type C4-dicarboxylate transport system permease small subunit
MGLLGIVCVFVMMLSTVTDVTGRYVFNNPILGTIELNRTLLAYLVFLGLAYSQFKKQHIRVDLLLTRVAEKPRALIEGFQLLLALVLIGFITYGGSLVAYESTVRGEYTPGIIHFPLWPPRIALALGSLVLCFQYVRDIVASFRSATVKNAQR